MGKFGVIREFLSFLRHERKWWLIPIVLILLLLGAVMVFVETNALAPLLYPLF